MKLYTNPEGPNDLSTAQGRANLKKDMFNALEYPDVYGLQKRRGKGSKCYEITVTVKAVRAAKKVMETDSLNLKSLSAEEFLQVLANFSREACASMDARDGLRSGLYLRQIDDALKLRQIAPMELDDVDLKRGVVYPSFAG